MAFLFLTLCCLALPAGAPAGVAEHLRDIRLPAGFHIEVWAEVPGARSLAVAADLRTVFVGSRGDAVYAVVDRDGDARADEAYRLARGLNVPNGIAWRDGWLYIAEQPRIIRMKVDKLPPPERIGAEIVYDQLPDLRWHGWRYAAFDPQGRLYVSVGAPCNVCAVNGLEGTILRFPAGGGEPEVFARGVRNPVGMDFHPKTGELFFTDNGADWMGDDSPPDELNHAPRPGMHFGFPFFGGGKARTEDFASMTPPPDAVFPAIEFDAHIAPLGIRFYRGTAFPAAHHNDAFVAQHGSWNRATPNGYRVMRVRFDAKGKALSREVFAEGWLKDGEAWGRPVDVAELWDGSLIVSDDEAGVIYRISYRP